MALARICIEDILERVRSVGDHFDITHDRPNNLCGVRGREDVVERSARVEPAKMSGNIWQQDQVLFAAAPVVAAVPRRVLIVERGPKHELGSASARLAVCGELVRAEAIMPRVSGERGAAVVD